MARRSDAIAVADGPGFTDVFRADNVGGADGEPIRSGLISVPEGAPLPAQYRLEDPADPAGEQFTLNPGDAAPVKVRSGVRHVVARGVGGPTTVGFEVIEPLV